MTPFEFCVGPAIRGVAVERAAAEFAPARGGCNTSWTPRARRRVVGVRHRRPAVGIAALADRKVVIGSQDGVLYCFG